MRTEIRLRFGANSGLSYLSDLNRQLVGVFVDERFFILT